MMPTMVTMMLPLLKTMPKAMGIDDDQPKVDLIKGSSEVDIYPGQRVQFQCGGFALTGGDRCPCSQSTCFQQLIFVVI